MGDVELSGGRHRLSGAGRVAGVSTAELDEVGPAPPARDEAMHEDAPAQGFDKSVNAICFVAVAIVVLVRPRELNFLRLLPFIVPLFLIALHLAGRTARGLRSTAVPYWIAVTVTWFVMTTAWSASRTLSIGESVAIICIAGAASLVASSCSLRELVGGVMVGGLTVLVASVAVGVAFPSYGIISGYEAGSLKGIMLDRNSLSFVLVLGLVAALSFEFRGRSPRLAKFVIVALFLGGVLWTSSSTCLILSVVAVVLAAALAMLRKVPPSGRAWALAAAALVTSGGVLYVVEHPDELYQLVDRDSTLTGRTQIWPVVEAVIATRPWLGLGWGAVWGNQQLNGSINRSVGFEVPHAHNGYLDVEVQVGAVGLILLLAVLALVAFRGLAHYLKSDSSLSSWPLILTVVLLVYNRVETSFSAPSTLFLIFATLVVLGQNQTTEHSTQLAQRRSPSPHGNHVSSWH